MFLSKIFRHIMPLVCVVLTAPGLLCMNNKELPLPTFSESSQFLHLPQKSSLINHLTKEISELFATLSYDVKNVTQEGNIQLYTSLAYLLCLTFEKTYSSEETSKIIFLKKKNLILLPFFHKNHFYILQFMICACANEDIPEKYIYNYKPYETYEKNAHILSIQIILNSNDQNKYKECKIRRIKPEIINSYNCVILTPFSCISHQNAEEDLTDINNVFSNPETIPDSLLLYLNEIPSSIHVHLERYFQVILFSLYNIFCAHKTEIEYKTDKGRIDILVRTPEKPMIIELKHNGKANDAIQQIEKSEYCKTINHICRMVGVNINTKNTTKNGISITTVIKDYVNPNPDLKAQQATPPLQKNHMHVLQPVLFINLNSLYLEED